MNYGNWVMHGAAALLLCAAPLASAEAQGWEPTEEVEIVTHTGTTSSTWTNADVIARTARELGLYPHGITVTIMEGARGSKARTYVARTHAGNPHKLQLVAPTQIAHPILARADISRSDFRGVAFMLTSPKVLTVNADSPYKTFDDLIETARANPGKVVQGGGDPGSTPSMVNRIMEDYFNVKFTYTPFDDQGLVQLLGGHIDFIFQQTESVAKYVKAGRLRILAATQKLEEFPDVPTLKELGYDFEVLDSWRGIWTSKDVPDEAVAYHVAALEKVMGSEAFLEYMRQNSMSRNWIVGDELEQALDREVGVVAKFAEEMNLIEK